VVTFLLYKEVITMQRVQGHACERDGKLFCLKLKYLSDSIFIPALWVIFLLQLDQTASAVSGGVG
jgi:hypothetical protein